MGDRGSKSVIFEMITVKEQRVDGSSYSISLDCVRGTLVAGKSGSCIYSSYLIHFVSTGIACLSLHYAYGGDEREIK